MKKEQWDATSARTGPTDEDEQVNQASALWARPKSEITEEQYHEFYKHVAHDFEPPLAYSHSQGRGPPGIHAAAVHPAAGAVRSVGPRAPARHQALRAARVHHGRRRAADAGVSALRARRDRLERPAAQRLARNPAAIARRRDDSRRRRSSACWRCSTISPSTTAGQISRRSGRSSAGSSRKASARTTATSERIAKLLRFASTHDDTDAQTVSLADYVGRMKDGQDAIYYVTADSFAAAKNSPHLEVFRKNGVEVLLMYDRIDEWVVSASDRVRRQAAAVGRQGRSRSGQARRRTPKKQEQEKEDRRVQGPARTHAEGAGRAGQRRARHAPPDRFAGVPGDRRAWHEHEPASVC